MKKTTFVMIAASWTTPSFAQALDCTGRDPAVCQAVNEMVPAVNAEVGSTLLSSASSRAAFRPANLYTALLQVRNAAVAGGCTIDGWSGGDYDANAGVQAWDGSLADLGQTPDDAAGTVTLTPATWSGAAGSRVSGLDVGVHNAAGQIAADLDDDGFKAGNWYRTVGSRGVFLALTGTCPGDAGDALDPWWQGDLASFGVVDPGDLFTFSFVDDAATDDIGPTAVLDWFQAMTGVDSSDYIYFSIFGDGVNGDGAWCSTNADWYRDQYLTTYTSSFSTHSGSWLKWSTTDGVNWTQDQSAYINSYGQPCGNSFGSWCSEWGLGGKTLAITPITGEDFSTTVESFANGWNTSTTTVTLRVAPTRLEACGF